MNILLRRAIEVAKNSRNTRHRVGCVVADRTGTILAEGWNVSGKTHPTQKRYMLLAGETNKEFLHAEIHALVKQYVGTQYSIYVARLTPAGNVGLAKPCNICSLAIKEAGICKVYYTK